MKKCPLALGSYFQQSDSNPGQLGLMRKHYRCAMPFSHFHLKLKFAYLGLSNFSQRGQRQPDARSCCFRLVGGNGRIPESHFRFEHLHDRRLGLHRTLRRRLRPHHGWKAHPRRLLCRIVGTGLSIWDHRCWTKVKKEFHNSSSPRYYWLGTRISKSLSPECDKCSKSFHLFKANLL